MFRILVVGAGYVGGESAKHFAAKGQRVTAIIRTSKREEALQQAGIQPVVADIRDPKALQGRLEPAHFVILCLAPELQDDESRREIYLRGIYHVLTELRTVQRPKFVLLLSSTGVWPKSVEGWVDETCTPVPDTERGKILFEAERQVLQFGFPSAVFRLGGIYGPGRNHLEDVRQGTWPKPGIDRYTNWIHRDDVVSAIRPILNRAKAGEVYLGVDHEPVLRSEVYRWIASKTGAPFDAGRLQKAEHEGKRCSNKRLRSLGFCFQYPSFRVGYEAFLPPQNGQIA